MRTSWEEQQRLMDAAKVLAEFSNLEPQGFAGFIAEHKDFAWWTVLPLEKMGGILTDVQEGIRDVWVRGFPIDAALAIIGAPILLAEQLNALANIGFPPPVWPYQQAVMFLHIHPNRAKICEWCGRRFITEYPKARFCSLGVTVGDKETICAWEYRKRYKKENWNKNRDELNKQRRRKYRLEHPKRKRRSYANRKNLRQG